MTLETGWFTKFHIGDWETDGVFDPWADDRLPTFCDHFPAPATVLELGCLEGGHTLALAQRVHHLHVIEARAANRERAQSVLDRAHVTNVTFHDLDLDTDALTHFPRVDVVFACGVLYHMTRPWALLRKLAHLSDHLFLSTHVAADDAADEHEGWRGTWRAEHGLSDPHSGLGERSFWLTPLELHRALTDAGYTDISPPFGPLHDANGLRRVLIAHV